MSSLAADKQTETYLQVERKAIISLRFLGFMEN